MPLYVSGETVLNATALGGVAAINFISQDGEFRPVADGLTDPGFAGILQSTQRLGIATYDLKQGIAAAGWNGTALSGAGLLSYVRPLTAGSVSASASSYLLTIATGMLVPRSLSAAQGSPAMLELECIPYNTSGTIPFTFATSSAAFNTPTQNQAYTLGPVLLNGSAIADVESVQIDFGINEQILMSDGTTFVKSAAIESRMPVVTINTRSAALASQVLAGGFAVTQLDIYFRRVTVGAGIAANASEVHALCSINVGVASNLQVQGRNVGTTIRVLPFYASATAVVALSSDVAIP